MMVRSQDYFACGGHSAIKLTMHDGLRLPRLFREAGFRTDLADLTSLATCRMYTSAAQVWSGLAKNATEGLGAPSRIVPISLLLFLGQVVPFLLLIWLVSGLLFANLFGMQRHRRRRSARPRACRPRARLRLRRMAAQNPRSHPLSPGLARRRPAPLRHPPPARRPVVRALAQAPRRSVSWKDRAYSGRTPSVHNLQSNPARIALPTRYAFSSAGRYAE